MSEDQREEALRALEQSFGERVKRGPIRAEEPGTEEALASVLPMSAEGPEIESGLRSAIEARHGRVLPAAQAHRVGGEVLPRGAIPPDPWPAGARADLRGRATGGAL